jgi:hypothetical protein
LATTSDTSPAASTIATTSMTSRAGTRLILTARLDACTRA